MIIIKLQGGLGNQMFQYAFGKALALSQKDKLKFDKLLLGHSLWKIIFGVSARHYELGQFDIQPEFASLKEILFSAEKIYVDGFWQNAKYFKDFRNTILNDFKLKKESKNYIKLKTKIQNNNSVSLHVRRGDYVKSKKTRDFHGLLGLDYYQKAVNSILKKTKNPKFFIFSDDIIWVKKNLVINAPKTFVSGSCQLTNAEELILMSKCKHNIIANSSFSWWGAWLNQNSAKIIFAPKVWVRASVSISPSVPGWNLL